MNNATVLIIDDEVQIRKLLTITLQAQDFNVTETATAKEGLTAVASHPPDLVLLDLGLPDRSGHEVLACLVSGTPIPSSFFRFGIQKKTLFRHSITVRPITWLSPSARVS